MLGQGASDHAGQVEVVEVGWRQVDRYRRNQQALTAPFSQLATGFAHRPEPQLIDQAALFGQGNKTRRGDFTKLWMVPARQRLDAIQQAVWHAHLWLVVELQLVQFEGLAQGALQGQALLGQQVQFVAEEAEMAATGAFCLVQDRKSTRLN